MASEQCVRRILTMNEAVFPNSMPKDDESRLVLLRLWQAVLERHQDAQVERATVQAFSDSKFPLRPADVVLALREPREERAKIPYVEDARITAGTGTRPRMKYERVDGFWKASVVP